MVDESSGGWEVVYVHIMENPEEYLDDPTWEPFAVSSNPQYIDNSYIWFRRRKLAE